MLVCAAYMLYISPVWESYRMWCMDLYIDAFRVHRSFCVATGIIVWKYKFLRELSDSYDVKCIVVTTSCSESTRDNWSIKRIGSEQLLHAKLCTKFTSQSRGV